MSSLKGKNIIVTGSEGLLGKNIVKSLIKDKANVLMIDIKNKTTNKNEKNYYCCDLTNKNSVLNLSKKILKKNKYINGLINCASCKIKERIKRYLNSKFENLSLILNHMIQGNLNSMFMFSNFWKNLSKKKVSLNFSSTYGIVGPDNAIYRTKTYKYFIKTSLPNCKRCCNVLQNI